MSRRHGGPGLHGAGGIPVSGVVPCPPAPWWDPGYEGLCVWGAWQPKGADSFAASLTDLSGNGNDASDPGGVNTPGWTTATGWGFTAASSHYLTTTFVPDVIGQSQTIIVQYTDCPDSVDSRWIIGSSAGSGRGCGLQPAWFASALYHNGFFVNNAPALTSGNLAVAGNQGYRNGIADGGGIVVGAIANTWAMYIGCQSASGTPGLFINANIQALAIYDCVLTASQIATVATAMAAI